MDEHTPLANLINLKGKGAVVTGGAAGIGLGISRRLAEAGAAVLIADVDADAGQQACAELNAPGYKTHFVRCNIGDEAEVKSMILQAVSVLGGVDILVNNAGIYPRQPLAEMTGADFDRVLAINLTGTFLCCRYAMSEMISRQQGGIIVNIASIEALHAASTGMAAYDASKGGVLSLTRSLAREGGRHDIRVNAVAPGGIKTRGVAAQTDASGTRAQLRELKSFLSRIALGRLGDADEVARVVLFLASGLSEYITGSLIVVDGGYLA